MERERERERKRKGKRIKKRDRGGKRESVGVRDVHMYCVKI